MENGIYKVDKLAIVQEQEERASEKIYEIENRCNVPVIAFFKSNFGFIKIRNRKSEPEITFLVGAALLKSAVQLGLKDIDNLHKPDILKAIFSHYQDLTLEEIYKAFELERYGMYDTKTEHFQLFNAEYVTTILKKYRAFKHRIKSENHISNNENSSTEITPEEKEAIVSNGINRVFNEFKETKTIDGPTEYIFDFLVEKGKIKTKGKPAVADYYQDKINEAKEQLKKENEIKNSSSSSSLERKNLKSDIANIISGTSPKIIIRAKRNILLEYFKKQLELNQQTIF
ncbi:hypothetical protein [Flavobacterium sp. FlaQc-50]|uniref:hypothetical protein n=1 Tax=unclassified Flavobacterium TaxID=196869 RepID=UPI00375806D9